MRRREFITLLGGTAAAWPLSARAQQPVPVIGLLDARAPDGMNERLRAFRQGLKETGYVEGENVSILYRWSENWPDQLPTMAAELVKRRVAVIFTAGGILPHLAAKTATTTIPIVFIIGEDPVKLGLVESLARPGGNLTGINFLHNELQAKRLELLREVMPSVARVAVLVNSANPANVQTTLQNVEPAARTMGLKLHVHSAGTSGEIDAAFAGERPDALFVGSDPFFNSRRVQLVVLASRRGLPATFPDRESAEIGGLMSYGSDIKDAYRQGGIHAGRILKGAKPGDMPVVQSTKFELVINLQTAKTLGLDRAADAADRADEVIE